MKPFKVQIPEGYEIDKENSTFENIAFKEVNKRAMSWEELGEIEGYYIDSDSKIGNGLLLSTVYKDNKNVFPTLSGAGSSLALAQLLQLRKNWIGDWEANWSVNDCYFIYRSYKGVLKVASLDYHYQELSFPTNKMAKDFLEAHEELIRVYFKMQG
tara:strand:- start:1411 stop:1878 length:468 start_codon:yes stop_codon:yes gene_type:complete